MKRHNILKVILLLEIKVLIYPLIKLTLFIKCPKKEQHPLLLTIYHSDAANWAL